MSILIVFGIILFVGIIMFNLHIFNNSHILDKNILKSYLVDKPYHLVTKHNNNTDNNSSYDDSSDDSSNDLFGSSPEPNIINTNAGFVIDIDDKNVVYDAQSEVYSRINKCDKYLRQT